MSIVNAFIVAIITYAILKALSYFFIRKKRGIKELKIPKGLSDRKEHKYVSNFKEKHNISEKDIWDVKLSSGENIFGFNPDKISAEQYYD